MLRAATFILLTALPLAAFAEDCEYRADRSLDIDAKGVSLFKLDTGAGDLVVEGVAGLATIEVRGKACASDKDAVAGIQFAQQREGSTVSVGTVIPDESNNSWSLFGNHYRYLDVRVRMPAGIKLDLRDSSGDLEVSGLTNGLDLKDSSGDITADGVKGNFTVGAKSGTSGAIRHHGVGGTVTLPPGG